MMKTRGIKENFVLHRVEIVKLLSLSMYRRVFGSPPILVCLVDGGGTTSVRFMLITWFDVNFHSPPSLIWFAVYKP